jgi:Ca-activated chloride channel family protein
MARVTASASSSTRVSVRTSHTLAHDLGDKSAEETFTLTLLPPADRDVKPRPRDVVFVLDRSGSMGGWKMVAARRAVARMVDTLNDSDRFSVFAFDHSIETPKAFKGPVLATATDRNRYRAIEFLGKLEARGGTEMATPLTKAAEILAGGYKDRDRVLVLVTDGQVGNESQILRSLSKRIKNVRIFTLGVDRAVNAGFLKRLAVMGGGACELVESEDRLDEVMDKIHRRIGTPVVTELGLEGKGLEIDRSSIVPSRLPDVFAGSPVVIRGRYRGKSEGSVTVKGQDAAGIPWEEGIKGAESSDDLARSIWARGYVRDLEDRYDSGHGDSDLAQKITSASLRFSVLCRFTAFLAVDRSVVVKGDGDPKKVTQAVDAPDGWAMFGAESDEDDREELAESAPESLRSMMAPPMGGMGAPGMAPPPPPMQALASAPMRKRSGAITAVGRVMSAPVVAAVGVAGAAAEAAKALGRAAGGGGAKKKAKPASRSSAAPPPAPPAPSRPPARHEAAGKFEQAEAPAGFDAYGDRIRVLLEELERASSRPARRRAADLAGRLRAMTEDLGSVGAPTTLIEALEKVVVALREALTSGAEDAELEKALEDAAKVLSQLASAKQPEQGSRREFWK